MNLYELILSAFRSLSSNLARTFLTMLGIIIGIASVISLQAIGNGSQESIQKSITSLGSNLLTITSSAARSGLVRGGANLTLTQGDVDALNTGVIPGIAAVSPEATQSFQVVSPSTSQNTNTTINGVVPQYASVHNYTVSNGNFISQDNQTNESKVAVIGPTTATTLFGSDNPVGQSIRINGIQFSIIGETDTKGSNGFQNSDDVVFIPLSTAERDLFGQTKYRTIVVQASDPNNTSVLQASIDSLLKSRHKIADGKTADYTIQNSADTLSTLSSITGTFTTLLAAIAGISLLVGGIGIMNIMIVTVTERTKEIGLRKAVGATRNSILSQFLVEAVILTFSGGLIGVGIGYVVSYILTATGILASSISVSSVFLATGISIIIGVIFGLYPAFRAARLTPIDALKYE
jgi:putative ABC transport system permease protein